MSNESNADLTNSSEISRRGLLCGIGAVAALTFGFAPENAIAAAGVTKLKNGKYQIDLAANKVLATIGGAVSFTQSDGSPTVVVRTAAGTKGISAVSLVCTHAGVTVQEVDKQWQCPAHGSLFALDGKLLGGPAKSALKKYPVTVSGSKATIG
jgi:Rieske Fe-S protein